MSDRHFRLHELRLDDLPPPRGDGECLACWEVASTRDGRFCRDCLRKLLARANPTPPSRGRKWLSSGPLHRDP